MRASIPIPAQRTIQTLSLILAPLLLCFAQFYWVNGLLTMNAGVLQFLACFCWVFAFQALFSLLETKMPAYAVIGFYIAVFSCFGGNNFGLDGIYSDAMGIDTLAEINELHQRIGGFRIIYLFIPGLLFPASLLVLGINLIRTKTLPFGTGFLLCLGAVGFPMSRIPRIDWLAHIDNGLLLLALCLVTIHTFRAKTPRHSKSEVRTSA